MDTYQARAEIRDLGREGLSLVHQVIQRHSASGHDATRLRQMVQETRASLADAGYPAEGVWQGLSRASLGVDTQLGEFDETFWESVESQLRDGIDTLSNLVGATSGSEPDIRIIG